MMIRVTRQNINRGERGNSTSCPVTLAAEQAGLHEVKVTRKQIYFRRAGCRKLNTLDLPIKVIDFIHKFDNNLPVEPFSFVMKTIQ